jgi:hypothetical protein
VRASLRLVPGSCFVALGLAVLCGCPGDDASSGSTALDTGEGSTAPTTDTTDPTATTETGDIEPGPTEGLFACPEGEACTFVVVAQAFDYRL